MKSLRKHKPIVPNSTCMGGDGTSVSRLLINLKKTDGRLLAWPTSMGNRLKGKYPYNPMKSPAFAEVPLAKSSIAIQKLPRNNDTYQNKQNKEHFFSMLKYRHKKRLGQLIDTKEQSRVVPNGNAPYVPSLSSLYFQYNNPIGPENGKRRPENGIMEYNPLLQRSRLRSLQPEERPSERFSHHEQGQVIVKHPVNSAVKYYDVPRKPLEKQTSNAVSPAKPNTNTNTRDKYYKNYKDFALAISRMLDQITVPKAQVHRKMDTQQTPDAPVLECKKNLKKGKKIKQQQPTSKKSYLAVLQITNFDKEKPKSGHKRQKKEKSCKTNKNIHLNLGKVRKKTDARKSSNNFIPFISKAEPETEATEHLAESQLDKSSLYDINSSRKTSRSKHETDTKADDIDDDIMFEKFLHGYYSGQNSAKVTKKSVSSVNDFIRNHLEKDNQDKKLSFNKYNTSRKPFISKHEPEATEELDRSRITRSSVYDYYSSRKPSMSKNEPERLEIETAIQYTKKDPVDNDPYMERVVKRNRLDLSQMVGPTDNFESLYVSPILSDDLDSSNAAVLEKLRLKRLMANEKIRERKHKKKMHEKGSINSYYSETHDYRVSQVKRFLLDSELDLSQMDNISIDDIDVAEFLNYPYDMQNPEVPEPPEPIQKKRKSVARAKSVAKLDIKTESPKSHKKCECCICIARNRYKPSGDDPLIVKMKEDLKRQELKAYIKNMQIFKSDCEKPYDSEYKFDSSGVLVPCQKPSRCGH